MLLSSKNRVLDTVLYSVDDNCYLQCGQRIEVLSNINPMIKIEKISVELPKWKWWQITILLVTIILALKVDPNKAFELLKTIISWIKG